MASVTPNVLNLTLTAADTEYSQALTAGAQSYSIQARTPVAVRFAFVTGKVAGSTAPFATLKAGQTFSFDGLLGRKGTEPTIFFASAVAGTIVEIVEHY